MSPTHDGPTTNIAGLITTSAGQSIQIGFDPACNIAKIDIAADFPKFRQIRPNLQTIGARRYRAADD